MTGAAAALAANALSDDMSDEGFGGGNGTIDSIGENAVVINDMKYKFASNVKFLSNTGSDLTKSLFKKGDPVDFVLNSDSELLALQKSQ
jgi:hypothetical protein